MQNGLRSLLMMGLFIFCGCASFDSASQKNRIVLIPGTDSHGVGEHEFDGGLRILAKFLNENVPGVQAVVTEKGWPKDTTLLDHAAAIVMYSDGAEGHMAIPHLAHLEKLAKKGVGLVGLHFAVEVPKGETGNRFLNWIGGYFETFYSVNPIWTPRFDSLPNHPITNGVKPFSVKDEWYYHMRFVENNPNLVPILRLLPPPSTLEGQSDGSRSSNAFVREDVLVKKIPQTLAWAFTRPEGGRGFGFTGGHYHQNWMNDDFRKLVLNAIVWAAKMNVPPTGVQTVPPTEGELKAAQKKSKPN